MAIAIIFILLLLGLTAVFEKVAEWFQENKKINITPAALIDVIAEIIFILHYGSKDTRDIIWMCVAIVIVIVINIFSRDKHLKYEPINEIIVGDLEPIEYLGAYEKI